MQTLKKEVLWSSFSWSDNTSYESLAPSDVTWLLSGKPCMPDELR